MEGWTDGNILMLNDELTSEFVLGGTSLSGVTWWHSFLPAREMNSKINSWRYELEGQLHWQEHKLNLSWRGFSSLIRTDWALLQRHKNTMLFMMPTKRHLNKNIFHVHVKGQSGAAVLLVLVQISTRMMDYSLRSRAPPLSPLLTKMTTATNIN